MAFKKTSESENQHTERRIQNLKMHPLSNLVSGFIESEQFFGQ